MSEARLVTVILMTDTIGKGVEGDPVQMRQQLFTKSGKLIASKTALGDVELFGSGWDHIEAEEES